MERHLFSLKNNSNYEKEMIRNKRIAELKVSLAQATLAEGKNLPAQELRLKKS